ncbi:MAG: hypothetical protein ACRETH_04305, partial [Steroidobacteraceae bacterium]
MWEQQRDEQCEPNASQGLRAVVQCFRADQDNGDRDCGGEKPNFHGCCNRRAEIWSHIAPGAERDFLGNESWKSPRTARASKHK